MSAEPSLLYVSDDPERFLSHGKLFHASLPGDGSAIRLLFDHVNGTNQPMHVVAAIANLGAATTTVFVLAATGGPSGNGMSVGHDATMSFLRSRELFGNAPAPYAINAGASVVLADATLQSGDCYAGLFDVTCELGAACEARVIACDPASLYPEVYNQLPEAPSYGKYRRGVFNATGISDIETLAYLGTAVTAQIGAAPFLRSSNDTYSGPAYAGGYGIVRRFSISTARDAVLYQSARGGSATATYIVGSQAWASHQIPAQQRSKIVSIAAGNQVSVVTMPEINSSYPLDLIIDVDDPQVAAAGGPGSPIYSA